MLDFSISTSPFTAMEGDAVILIPITHIDLKNDMGQTRYRETCATITKANEALEVAYLERGRFFTVIVTIHIETGEELTFAYQHKKGERVDIYKAACANGFIEFASEYIDFG